jgi:tetratricopeptide (TPR) repeat protein
MSSIARPLRCGFIGGIQALVLVVPIVLILLAIPVSAQELRPVIIQGQPVLKYTDNKGCESTISFGRFGGSEEALSIRVIHFHGSTWGEKGWLFIARNRIFFGPDTGQKDEHAFSIPRGEFKEAKVSIDHKVRYLTIISNGKKNQEFAIGCFGNTHDVDDMFIPVLNYAVLAGNDFDAGAKEFQQLTAKVQPRKAEQDTTIEDLLPMGPKTSSVESTSRPALAKEDTLDAKTLVNLGKTHIKLHLYDEAIIAFKQAVQIKADSAEAYNGLGDAYLYSGHPQEAITAYTDAIKINPTFAEAYNGLGIAYSDTYQPEQALNALRQAVKLQPTSPSNFYFVGLTYKKLGKRKEAIEALREAVRLNPKYADPYEALGDIYSNSKEYAAAVDVYRSLVQLRPDSSTAHSTLANSYFNSGRNQDALNEYELTIKLNPKEPISYHNIANTYAVMGRFDEAIKNYKLAIDLKSDYVPSHFMLGRAFVKKGDKASAIEQYNVLKSLDPNAAKLLLDEINK